MTRIGERKAGCSLRLTLANNKKPDGTKDGMVAGMINAPSDCVSMDLQFSGTMCGSAHVLQSSRAESSFRCSALDRWTIDGHGCRNGSWLQDYLHIEQKKKKLGNGMRLRNA